MIIYKTLLSIGAALAIAATPALAAAQSEQEAAAATTPAAAAIDNDVEPDADRLAAANRLVAILYSDSREAAVAQAGFRRVFANMIQYITDQQAAPSFEDALKVDPRAPAIFERFATRYQERAIQAIDQEMPRMRAAAARAYARQFSGNQLDEMQRFFAAPTGQLYLDVIRNFDPNSEFLRIQYDAVIGINRPLQPILEDLRKELEALAPKR